MMIDAENRTMVLLAKATGPLPEVSVLNVESRGPNADMGYIRFLCVTGRSSNVSLYSTCGEESHWHNAQQHLYIKDMYMINQFFLNHTYITLLK